MLLVPNVAVERVSLTSTVTEKNPVCIENGNKLTSTTVATIACPVMILSVI